MGEENNNNNNNYNNNSFINYYINNNNFGNINNSINNNNNNNKMSPRPNTAVVPIKMREDMLEDPFFSCNWSDFDAHRTGLMKKSGTDFWDQVEKDMGKFESSLAAMERDMERRMGPMRGNVPDWAIPEDHRDNWPVSLPDQPDMELTGFRSQKIKDTDL